jgi:UDP-N-acetylglucosamine:LPS N-acetylglucosamine transferase
VRETIDGRRSATGSRHGGENAGAVDVLLVCHSGGHLAQLALLQRAWAGYSCAWVTDASTDAQSLLEGKRVYFGYGPAARSGVSFFRNLRLALQLIEQLKPKIVISTGAAMCVPFIWVARVRGVRIAYIETVTRIDAPSLTCRLVRPAATRVYVQWPELAKRVPGAIYVGSVFPTS